MEIIKDAGRFTGGAPNTYLEHLRVAALSVGTYSIPVGGWDDQIPHAEDEIYVVQAGQGRLVTESETAEVGPGSVIYVPAGETHRFTDVSQDLALLVFFAPPFSGE